MNPSQFLTGGPSPIELAERQKLANTAGLTRAQKAYILDPECSLRQANILLNALRAQAIAAHAAKPEALQKLERDSGLTKTVSNDAVTFDGTSQRFGGVAEVPRV